MEEYNRVLDKMLEMETREAFMEKNRLTAHAQAKITDGCAA